MKKMLKFKSKSSSTRTSGNIDAERNFSTNLGEIFEIRKTIVPNNRAEMIAEPAELVVQNEAMEVDNANEFNGI